MKANVIQIIERVISEDPSLFLIDVSVSEGGDILVVLDGDAPVSIDRCVRISREIQDALQGEAYSLQVSSFDVTKHLVHQRQYVKNLNRQLEVKDSEGIWVARLCEVSDHGILLKWRQREPKPIGKGKITVEKQRHILFENIIQAKVKLKF